ncbi:MAG: hypothetical protein MJZ26_14055 [Fibrobacter sp.]|nr:hypothetical protein [Fibrobacter sp.]
MARLPRSQKFYSIFGAQNPEKSIDIEMQKCSVRPFPLQKFRSYAYKMECGALRGVPAGWGMEATECRLGAGLRPLEKMSLEALSSDFLYGVRGTHIVAARKCQKEKMLFAASLAFCYICNAKSKRFIYENFA